MKISGAVVFASILALSAMPTLAGEKVPIEPLKTKVKCDNVPQGRGLIGCSVFLDFSVPRKTPKTTSAMIRCRVDAENACLFDNLRQRSQNMTSAGENAVRYIKYVLGQQVAEVQLETIFQSVCGGMATWIQLEVKQIACTLETFDF